ncbi:hypothetical protein DFS33DRAFT_1292348 [Desarmillaria ectypa]|nr:hypothetical protein DFS33DRAFT_1292348 [Desarmillaria ectypa]
MSLSHFRLCIFAIILPLALSLEITLNSTPIVLQSTAISLRWTLGDPETFNLGVYRARREMTRVLPDHSSDVLVKQVVTNFTQDQNVNMTFNHTVVDVKDHRLVAWVDGPYKRLARSDWFAVDVPSTAVTESGEGTISSSTDSSAVTSTPPAATEEETPTAILAQTKTASHAGAIVGGVLGSLALLSIISALILFMLRRRRRSRNSAPSRAFWKYLDEKKGPASSESLQYPSPTYSPGVQARPLSLRPEDYYHRTK